MVIRTQSETEKVQLWEIIFSPKGGGGSALNRLQG